MKYQACATATGTRVHLRDAALTIGNAGTRALCGYPVAADRKSEIAERQLCNTCMLKALSQHQWRADWITADALGVRSLRRASDAAR